MSNIHVFHGIDSKVGTTMITQSTAEYIAGNIKDLKVMMVSMNGRCGSQYVDKIGETIEGLKLHLDNRLLNIARLKEQCHKKDNLYVLGGIENFHVSRVFQPETATYLLESLEKAFDLIIVDAGNDIDNGLAVGALEYIKERTCIITQQESTLDRFESLSHIYHGLGLSFSTFVVNKFLYDDPYDLRYIEKRLSINPGSVFKVGTSGYDRRAECDHRTLLSYKTIEFCKDISVVANRILAKAYIDPIVVERKKKWNPFS